MRQDLNVTQAVQLSEAPNLRGYHRRIIADWNEGPLYVLWDAIDVGTDRSVCKRAISNLHVLTELGWNGKVGCTSSASTQFSSSVHCNGLNDTDLHVHVVRPSRATTRKLLTIKADPMPAQFTGVVGRQKYGAAFAGDWNNAVSTHLRCARPFF